ncbi:hypothetical protein NQZ68_010382 [Dissostichus eleginoides]|nr:hypothetical protein NQZ68_010382 [Dissostichus eleginoides]
MHNEVMIDRLYSSLVVGKWKFRKQAKQNLSSLKAISMQNLGPNSILQDDNARPHRARIITEYLQNLRSGEDGMACRESRPQPN